MTLPRPHLPAVTVPRGRSLARTLAIATLAFVAVAPLSSLAAQRLGPAPKRPRIDSADTNDARAYFDYGVRFLKDKPFAAADAFYWAARIDPGASKQGEMIPAGADVDVRLQRLLLPAVASTKWGDSGWYRAEALLDREIGEAVKTFSKAPGVPQ